MTDRTDRLYELLPVIHRMRDHERGEPLRALLQVITEQVNLVEDDIHQLYDNWFIETCQDWVVPYIGDLIGYTPTHEAGEPGDPTTAQAQARNKILVSRREVANTIGYRRRKGALALLELLAHDVAGWPARAVEFYTLLGWMQHLNHQRPARGRTAELRDGDALDLIDGPFDPIAHSVDVRRINSQHTVGRYNITSVGLFVWRLKSYGVTRTQANYLETAGCYTFSALGNDTPLYIRPEAEPTPTHIAGELNVPAPIRRRAFEERVTVGGVQRGQAAEAFYGEEKSLAIWAPNWPAKDAPQPIPRENIIPADLTGWKYRPRKGYVAVDPVLGRIMFPSQQRPRLGVTVSYRYGFSADIGGGEYPRPTTQPEDATFYYVVRDRPEEKQRRFSGIAEALRKWNSEKPAHAVIEIAYSQVFDAQMDPLQLAPGQSLQIRAASGARPILRLQEAHVDQTDAWCIRLKPGSHFVLDGFLVSSRGIHVEGPVEEKGDNGSNGDGGKAQETSAPGPQAAGGTTTEPPSGASAHSRPAQVTIRHCTLVPGWTLNGECEPKRPAEPSLTVAYVDARVVIEHSILGSIMVLENEVETEPIAVDISDSIVDATHTGCDGPECVALSALPDSYAHAVLTIRRSTVLGKVLTHAIELGENTIFDDTVRVVRSQRGCLRFSYAPPGSRTPRRYHCQPDLVEQSITADYPGIINKAERDWRIAQEQLRVRPRFNSRRYGTPTYCQLAADCAEEIQRGADDESEMGVFHDLYQPQRAANLAARLEEYTPAGTDAGIIFAS